MASIRTRAARRLVQAMGIKARMASLADVEHDPAALLSAVAKLRRSDRRRPPRTVRRSWNIDRVECGGSDLFVMSHEGGPRKRVILYLHGGGYMFGPFASDWAAMRRLADRIGTDFAILLYPRVPEHDARATLEATEAAYAFLLERYGAGNLTVIGTSAGGGLAVALMVALRDSGGALPSCAILLSPSVDMIVSDDVSALEAGDVLLSVDYVRLAGRLYAGDLGPDHPVVSPINSDLSGLPPMHLFVADSEIFRPSIEAFAEQARATGTEAHLILGEDAQHTWPLAPTPEGRRALEEMVEIVRGCG